MATDPIRAGGDARASAAGDRLAMLFEEHGRMVYGLCRALLRDADEADDATQSVFVSAYTSLLGGSVVREPAAWLATIARHECGARAKARMREPLPLLESDLALAAGPAAEVEQRHAAEELRASIANLPEKQREAVVLRDLYGLPYAEVGAALGLSVASVESLLFRARRSLRGTLKPLATGALTVPLAVREGVARALPEVTTRATAGGGTGSGILGLGLLAKFAGAQAGVKATAGIAAAVAAGTVAITSGGNGVPLRATPDASARVVAPRPGSAVESRVLRTGRAGLVANRRGLPIARAGASDSSAGGSRSAGTSDSVGASITLPASRDHVGSGGGEGDDGGGRSDTPEARRSQEPRRDDVSSDEHEDANEVTADGRGASNADHAIASDRSWSGDNRSPGSDDSSGSGSGNDGSGSSGHSGESALEHEAVEDELSRGSGSGRDDDHSAEESDPVAPS